MVRGPDLTDAIDGDACWTTLHRDRADVSTVVLQMTDCAAIERVCNPHVIVSIDHAALCKRVALVERAEQRTVRRKLANLAVAKRRVPNVAAAINAEAIARMVEAGPVAAIWTSQRLAGVPTQHRVR